MSREVVDLASHGGTGGPLPVPPSVTDVLVARDLDAHADPAGGPHRQAGRVRWLGASPLDRAGRTGALAVGPVPGAAVIALVVLALVVGAAAGYEEARRRFQQRAVTSSALLAWTNGFDAGQGSDGDGATLLGRRLRVQVTLATTASVPITVTNLQMAGQPVRLRNPVVVLPGQDTSFVGYTRAPCTTSGQAGQSGQSGQSGQADRAQVRTEDGREYTVPVRTLPTGLDALIRRSACPPRSVSPARVTSMQPRADGAVVLDIRAGDGTAPAYLRIDVAPGRTNEWSAAVDPAPVVPLISGRSRQVTITLNYLGCRATSGTAAPPRLPTTTDLLSATVLVGFMGYPREVQGWDDDVVSAAATAAAGRACRAGQ